jgi:hypothetical protein
MAGSTFQTNPIDLNKLLDDCHRGIIQLPDFQRTWVWDEDRIKSLIASVSRAFPVGVLMSLETGGPVNFKPRPVEGALPDAKGVSPQSLLLDGQQRMTSLYQVTLRAKVVETITPKKKKVKRWFYIDIRKSLDPSADREEAIVGLPEDKIEKSDFGRVVKLDLSAAHNEYAAQGWVHHRASLPKNGDAVPARSFGGHSAQTSPIESRMFFTAAAAASGAMPGGGSWRATTIACSRAWGSARSFAHPCSSHSRMAPASSRTASAQPSTVRWAGRCSFFFFIVEVSGTLGKNPRDHQWFLPTQSRSSYDASERNLAAAAFRQILIVSEHSRLPRMIALVLAERSVGAAAPQEPRLSKIIQYLRV